MTPGESPAQTLAPCGCTPEKCRPELLHVSVLADLVRRYAIRCLACGNTFMTETPPLPVATMPEPETLVSALPSGTLVKYRQLGAALRTRGESDAADAILELTELLRAVDAALVSEHEGAIRMAEVVRRKNQALAAAEVEKTSLALQIVEAATALLRWIPVEERLPKRGTRVVVAVADEGWDRTYEVVYFDTIFPPCGARVTHWIPLPAPPEANPIVGRAEPAPPVEGSISFAIERIVPADDVDAVTGRRRHMLASHLAEMMSLLAGSLDEPRIGRRDYRIRISVEPES